MTDQSTTMETIQATGGQILDTVKNLIHEGNVRRITIKQDGRTIVELPLTIGAVGVLAAPWLAAVGAIAAVVSRCTIEVERGDAGDGSAEASVAEDSADDDGQPAAI